MKTVWGTLESHPTDNWTPFDQSIFIQKKFAKYRKSSIQPSFFQVLSIIYTFFLISFDFVWHFDNIDSFGAIQLYQIYHSINFFGLGSVVQGHKSIKVVGTIRIATKITTGFLGASKSMKKKWKNLKILTSAKFERNSSRFMKVRLYNCDEFCSKFRKRQILRFNPFVRGFWIWKSRTIEKITYWKFFKIGRLLKSCSLKIAAKKWFGNHLNGSCRPAQPFISKRKNLDHLKLWRVSRPNCQVSEPTEPFDHVKLVKIKILSIV